MQPIAAVRPAGSDSATDCSPEAEAARRLSEVADANADAPARAVTADPMVETLANARTVVKKLPRTAIPATQKKAGVKAEKHILYRQRMLQLCFNIHHCHEIFMLLVFSVVAARHSNAVGKIAVAGKEDRGLLVVSRVRRVVFF